MSAMPGWTLAATLCLGLSLAGPARAIPMLVVELSDDVIGIGVTTMATVKGTEIPTGADGKGLFGFGFEITFAAVGLSASTPDIDPIWTGNTAVAAGVGSVGATANRVGENSGPSGPVVLASVVFTGLAEGQYTLQLGLFTGPGDNVLFDGTCLDATDDCTVPNGGFFGSIGLQVVPEPGAAVLLLLAAAVWQSALCGSRRTGR